MACTEVRNAVDIEVTADQTEEIILSFIAGIIIALIIALIIVVIRCRRLIKEKVKEKCCCCVAPGLCCCFAVAAVGGENDLSKAYLIHSWEDSEEPLIHSQKELVEKPKKKPENDTFSDEEEEDEEPGSLNPIMSDDKKFRTEQSKTSLHSTSTTFTTLSNSPIAETSFNGDSAGNSFNDDLAGNNFRDDSAGNSFKDESAGNSFNDDFAGNSFNDSSTENNFDYSPTETRFNDETNFKADEYTRLIESPVPLFADIFIASRELRQKTLYNCDKRAVLKLESCFIRDWMGFFLLLVEKLSAKQQATEEWKSELIKSCHKSIGTAHQRYNSELLTEFEDGPIGSGKLGMVGLDTRAAMMQIVDKIYFSLRENKCSITEVEEMINKFEQDMAGFEMRSSTIYLQEVQKLHDKLNLKEVLVEKLAKNVEELLDEMTSLYSNHVKMLEKIRMGTSLSTQDQLAPEVQKIWASAIKKFKKALAKQKVILGEDIRNRLGKNDFREKFEEEIQKQKEQLLKGEIMMSDFVDSYSSELRDMLSRETKQENIEISFVATEFSALIEMLGIKHLKRGIKKESTLLSNFSASTTWIAPDVLQMITQLQTDLSNLQVSLRNTQQRQASEIRSIINTPALGPPLTKVYLHGIIMETNFTQKMLEMQVDLSEMEQETLKEIVMALSKSCETVFELKKLKQERQLKNEIKDKRIKFFVRKAATVAGNADIRELVELNREEEKIEATDRELVEDTKRKLYEKVHSTRKSLELLIEQKMERIRRGHENDVNLVTKQEKALHVLKSKLLEKVSNSSEQVVGERLLQEYQINIKVLDEEIERSRKHQEQVLQQKIQARKLEKTEDKHLQQQHTSVTKPYTVGNATKFAADCLVSLLMEVRHKQSLKEMERYHTVEGDKLKSKLERRFHINTKLGLQLREREMIVKLASALNMSRKDLEKELKDSMSAAAKSAGGKEADVLLSKSILGLFDDTHMTL